MNDFALTAFARAVRGRRLAWLAPLFPGLALANPTGGQVVSGGAAISSPDANTVRIDQTTASAAINWQSFSIAQSEYVVFNQPSASAVVLNRVVGGNPSEIFGHLLANGRVFLVNPSGILFAPGAQVDVGALVASTLDISDADFNSGRYVFSGDSTATVSNAGTITATSGGFVVLAGDTVQNTGLVQAQLGQVVLASGKAVTLTLADSGLISYAIDQAALSDHAGVSNAGSLIANGGRVVMAAKTAQGLARTVVNNTGLVQAQSIVDGENGEIILSADGGDVENAGTLDASGTSAAPDGGKIVIRSDANARLATTSVLNTAGATDTATGGSVHLSGKSVSVRGTLNIGRGGLFLLDPSDVVIGDGSYGTNPGKDFYEKQIESLLKAGTNVQVVASHKITMEQLTDHALDGRNAGYGGSLLLGIGTLGSGSASTVFTEGPGGPGGGVFDYAGDSIFVDHDLQIYGGASYGSINVGKLQAGHNLYVQGHDAVTVGDITINAPSNGSLTIHSQAGDVTVGKVKMSGPGGASADIYSSGTAAIVKVLDLDLTGSHAAAYVTSHYGDVAIGDPQAPTATAVHVAGTNGGGYFSAIAGSTGVGDLTISGNIDVTANQGNAGVSLYAYQGGSTTGFVDVTGTINVAATGTSVSGDHGDLYIYGAAGVTLHHDVTVSGYGGSMCDGPCQSPQIGASADIYSQHGSVIVGEVGGQTNAPVVANITVKGFHGGAALVIGAGTGSGAAGNVDVNGKLTVAATGGSASLDAYVGNVGDVTIRDSVLVTGGGGTYLNTQQPLTASARLRTNNGSVTVTNGVTVRGTAADFTYLSSHTGTFGGAYLNVRAGTGSSQGITLGKIDVSGVGQADVELSAGHSIAVTGPITVQASRAVSNYVFSSSYGGGNTTDLSGEARLMAGGSCSGSTCFYSANTATFGGPISVTGPSATLDVQAYKMSFAAAGAAHAISVSATGTRTDQTLNGVTSTFYGGIAKLYLYGSSFSNDAVLVNGNVSVTALATGGNAYATFGAGEGNVIVNGNVRVEDAGSVALGAMVDFSASGSGALSVSGDLLVRSGLSDVRLDTHFQTLDVGGNLTLSAGRNVYDSTQMSVTAGGTITARAGTNVSLSNATLTAPHINLQAGVSDPSGSVHLSGTSLTAQTAAGNGTVLIAAANGVFGGSSSLSPPNSLTADGFGIAAGNVIALGGMSLTAGSGAAPFGADPLLGTLLAFGAPGVQPASAAPNAAFAAPSVSLTASKLTMTGDHLYIRTDSLDLGSATTTNVANVPTNLLVEFQPYTMNAPIHVADDYTTLSSSATGLLLDRVHIFDRFPGTTYVFGGSTYFGNIVIDPTTSASENFVFITNGNASDLSLIGTSGTVSFIQPFILFNRQITPDQYTPSQDTTQDDKDKPKDQEDVITDQASGDEEGEVQHQTQTGKECL